MKHKFGLEREGEEEFDFLQKIIIIGDSGVGKSNILLRFSKGTYTENHMATIGLNFVYKVVTIDDVKVKLQIWDTAGQDKFKTITKSYYRNSQGVLIVFGVDCRDSYYSVCTLLLSQKSGWTIYPTPPVTRLVSCLWVTNRTWLRQGRWVGSRQRLWLIIMEFSTWSAVPRQGKMFNSFLISWGKQWKLSSLIILLGISKLVLIVKSKFRLLCNTVDVVKSECIFLIFNTFKVEHIAIFLLLI